MPAVSCLRLSLAELSQGPSLYLFYPLTSKGFRVDNNVYNGVYKMSVTFTKLFSSITESTIWCEESDVRIVWITMLAMSDRHGRVWASVPGLANRSQVSLEATKSALDKFLSPDEYSRTPDQEGRRIELIDGGWRLLNHEKYREIRDEEERKVYKREWIKNKRAADKYVDNVDSSRQQSTYTDTDTDTDIKKEKPKAKRFAPPTQNEVLDYMIEKGNSGKEAGRFIDFYESKGWLVGRNKMKDWKAAVRNWIRDDSSKTTQSKIKSFKDIKL
jgi:hypothetical protein